MPSVHTLPNIPAIDGLRAVAVLSVIIFHVDFLTLPGGFTGVDMFFVISGYVISQSLYTRSDMSFSAYLADFYRRLPAHRAGPAGRSGGVRPGLGDVRTPGLAQCAE